MYCEIKYFLLLHYKQWECTTHQMYFMDYLQLCAGAGANWF